MNGLATGFLSVLLVTNQPVAVSNLNANRAEASVLVTKTNAPVEKEFEKLLNDEEAAQAEIAKWVKDFQALDDKSDAAAGAELNQRIKVRLEVVRTAYENFLRQHPTHTDARLAYASFLGGIHEQDASHDQLEKARELDPKNPAPWNDLANFYGHFGPVKKSFEYYAKAIELNPLEPVYFQNFATTVFLFRKDAREFYDINEQQVFDKALELYNRAIKLDPDNYDLATDVARTYYGIKPPRTAEALVAWEYTLKVASCQVERESVFLNLARIKLNAGRFDEARQHLNAVTNEVHMMIKNRLIRNLLEKETKAKALKTSSSGAPDQPPAAH